MFHHFKYPRDPRTISADWRHRYVGARRVQSYLLRFGTTASLGVEVEHLSETTTQRCWNLMERSLNLVERVDG